MVMIVSSERPYLEVLAGANALSFAGSAQHGEQLADPRFVGLRTVFTDFESFVIPGGIALFGAIPLHQRRPDGWRGVAGPGALQPRFALRRILRDFRQRARHPRQPVSYTHLTLPTNREV